MDGLALISDPGVDTHPAVAARSDEELIAAIHDSEAAMRAAMATQLRAIAEAEDRGLPTAQSARNTEAWLKGMLNIASGEAKNRAMVARLATERTTPDGTPVPAELPATARAIASGAITVPHARAIADGIRRLAPISTATELEQAETMLAGYAAEHSPHQLSLLAERTRYHLDQNGAYCEEETQRVIRELNYGTAADGMTIINARLDRETGAKFRAVLQPLAAPRPTTDGELDPRSPAQRNADALDALLDIAIASDKLPRPGGQRPHIAVTIDFNDLARALGGDGLPGTLTATGQPITAENVRRMACDAEVLPVVLGSDNLPLNVGRAERTAPPHIRAALLLRDDTCAFPSCDRPPGTPEAHHLTSWIDGGATELNNLVMLCGHHHRTIHNQRWTIRMEEGRPLFTPPSTVDPSGRPRPGGRPTGSEHNEIIRRTTGGPADSSACA
ncbi:HNH endonuclease [Saccharopolyspora indica]|uniref:HNH endonuclease signature motif containing protein n=1 Tax=Saccharopolyspora indica TaxID=1229659 RepID=UPI0022EB25E8|nr:HNH endonuclease signature motif containing protein [Saccharopolyspora indica]MDA3642851.1 DUF222 domain-containing protein [Saccharopolyspora indica]